MGGVDRLDQNIAQYRPSIRGKKWYFPIVSYLITVCVNNAWIFAREGGYKDDILSFTRTNQSINITDASLPPEASPKGMATADRFPPLPIHAFPSRPL